MLLPNICVTILPTPISMAVTSFLYILFFNDHIDIFHDNLFLSILHSKILLLVGLYRLSLILQNLLLSLSIHSPIPFLHLCFLLASLVITCLFPTYLVMMSYLTLIFNTTFFYFLPFHPFYPFHPSRHL